MYIIRLECYKIRSVSTQFDQHLLTGRIQRRLPGLRYPEGSTRPPCSAAKGSSSGSSPLAGPHAFLACQQQCSGASGSAVWV